MTIKIDFEDKSFILFEDIDKESIRITMCGKKDFNSTIMSSSVINKKQAKEVYDFLTEWIK